MKNVIGALLGLTAGAMAGAGLAQDLERGLPPGLQAQIVKPETIRARQKIFGIENVDAQTGQVASNKVLFSWLSNSSFAAAVEGRIILLDTYITRLEVTPGRTPVVIGDLVDLQPEAILLGHGHFDHADNAAYIAAHTGAQIFASEETCAAMQTDFAREKSDSRIQGNAATRFPIGAAIRCSPVTTAGSTPGTQLVRVPVFDRVACVLAFRHMHSVAVPPDPTFAPTPVQIIVDPRDASLFPPGTPLTPAKNAAPAPGQMDLTTAQGAGAVISIYYQFIMRDGNNFTFAWHNTAGALKEGCGSDKCWGPAVGQGIVNVLKSLPPTDLQLGTASSGNFNNNGLRDLIMYQQAIQPKVYIPNHLTSGTATREASSLSVYVGYLQQLENMEQPATQWPGYPSSQWPDVRWLVDPTDYLRPLPFNGSDQTWKNPAKAQKIASFCS